MSHFWKCITTFINQWFNKSSVYRPHIGDSVFFLSAHHSVNQKNTLAEQNKLSTTRFLPANHQTIEN